MFDTILVSIFVLGAVLYLACLLRKKIRALRNPKASPGCSCSCVCTSSKPRPKR